MAIYHNTNKPYPLICGIIFLFYISWSMILCGINLILDFSINSGILPLSIFLSGVSTYWISRDIHKTLFSALILILTLVVSSWLMSLIYDTAFDSNGYHLRTVVALGNGWNPVYERYTSNEDLSLWSEHYAKGLELIYSTIFVFTNNLESTKSANIILFLATLIISNYTLKETCCNISKNARYLILAMIASNTIVVNQLFSAMNDFALWLETCILICGFILVFNKKDGIIPYIFICVSLILSINTKFTHFFFVYMGCLFFAVYCLIYKEKQLFIRGCITVCVSLFIGIVIVGYNPYITNTLGYGSPVYPLGTDKVDIMTGNTPEMLHDGNRFSNVVKSYLSLQDKPWALVKLNFNTKDIVNSYTVSGSRLNGFGAAMPILIIFSLILMIYTRPKLKYWSIYIFVWTLCFIFKEGWWARYMVFFWINLILPVVLYFNSNLKSKFMSYLISAYSIIMFSGAITSFSIMLGTRLGYTHYLNYIAEQSKLKSYSPVCLELNDIHRQQFSQQHMRIIEVQEADINEDGWFYVFGDGFFDSMIYLPEEVYPALYEKPITILDRLARYNIRKYSL